MTDEQRKRIFDVLLGDGATLPIGDVARRALEDSSREQLNQLEPVIDQIIKEECDGRNQIDRAL